MVDKEGETRYRDEQELHPECIMVTVICGAELQEHQIDCANGGGDEDDLHGGVVEGDEVSEQVQVARQVDQRKHDLCLAGQT